jgi:hypothetical protein
MANNKLFLSMTVASLALLAAFPAKADNTASTTTTAVTATATPASSPLPMPQMAGPLGLDTTPYSFDGGALNKIYVSGVASVMGIAQDHATSSDKSFRGDFSNAQVFVQNTTGPVQFYLQGGGYNLPTLGTPYLRSLKTTSDTYGYLPQGYLKYAPTSNASLMVGKLPTLIGDEYTFTFQNMNIERGLLWQQENAVNRGIQGNYSTGPFSFSLSLNDGFYSDHYSWVTGLVTYSIDSNDALAFDAGGNTAHSDRDTLATPVAQNNSTIYNLMYTHTDGPWTINPYLQYTHVAENTDLGLNDSAATWGAALLTKYTFDQNYSLAARAEYINTTGDGANGAPNLLYGPGSRAMSLTITPTYQFNMFFGRFDASYTHAFHITDGDAFGSDGDAKAQGRLVLEAGIMF